VGLRKELGKVLGAFTKRSNNQIATKALLIKLDVNFPYVDDLAELLTLVEKAREAIPERIKHAEKLSRLRRLYPIPRYGTSSHGNGIQRGCEGCDGTR
jgi:HEPN domain-containing protein